MTIDDVSFFSRKISQAFDLEVFFNSCSPMYLGKYYPNIHQIELEKDLLNNPSDLFHFLLHEAVHSTSHSSIIGRDSPGDFGYNEFLEEYIAEVTALMLGRMFGNKLSKNRKKERLDELKKCKNQLSKTQLKYAKKEVVKAYFLLVQILGS